MKVAAYLRVSTDEQVESGHSLLEQRERLKAYAKVMGWDKPTFYIDDGYSAGSLKRPQLQKLIKDIESRKVNILMTTKLDRLSRNLLDLLQVIKFMETHDCNYVSATESFDTSTAAGRMVLHLLGVFAEFERGRTSERVKDNMTSLARNTNMALSGPCFGFDIIDKQYVLNKKEAKYGLKMVEMTEAGHGTRSIAQWLNSMNVKTKRGKQWDSTAVRRLLRTETICGTRIMNKRKKVNGKTVIRPKEEWIIKENNHEGFISPERFKNLQNILDSRKINKQHENETYLLTGILKCGYCGGTMKGSSARVSRGDKKYEYYRYICSSYVKGSGCKHHAAHREDIENAVITQIESVTNSSDKELQLKVVASNENEDVVELKRALESLDKQMMRQIEAYGKGLIEEEDLERSNKYVKEQRQLLRNQLDSLKQINTPQALKEKAKTLLPDIKSLDRKKAKTTIAQLIDSLVLTDGELDIVWRI
ncbi:MULTISPECIES: recombinase family protein [unclassified Virgibacillus]|uniref:recombinase family protein n=1 Tax=unclassified Virgibacillus TaxID=2620237 RepID=UPI00090CD110|nr:MULTISPECIES: recombinase family protein [unclassified Virgibacillus]API93981.1 site-specific recombinase [Virgibacillus sp. 6R]MBS7427470.1 recombinase family protein [Virgibacillus sp. 19R1-5]